LVREGVKGAASERLEGSTVSCAAYAPNPETERAVQQRRLLDA